jgi:hypothetical protein
LPYKARRQFTKANHYQSFQAGIYYLFFFQINLRVNLSSCITIFIKLTMNLHINSEPINSFPSRKCLPQFIIEPKSNYGRQIAFHFFEVLYGSDVSGTLIN